MRDELDRIAVGARIRRLGADFRWPGDRKVAAFFNVAYEGWSNAAAPGLGPMGNPLPPGPFVTDKVYSPTGAVEIDGLAKALADMAEDGDIIKAPAPPPTRFLLDRELGGMWN